MPVVYGGARFSAGSDQRETALDGANVLKATETLRAFEAIVLTTGQGELRIAAERESGTARNAKGRRKTDDAGLRMRLPSRALLSQTALSYGSVIPI